MPVITRHRKNGKVERFYIPYGWGGMSRKRVRRLQEAIRDDDGKLIRVRRVPPVKGDHTANHTMFGSAWKNVKRIVREQRRARRVERLNRKHG